MAPGSLRSSAGMEPSNTRATTIRRGPAVMAASPLNGRVERGQSISQSGGYALTYYWVGARLKLLTTNLQFPTRGTSRNQPPTTNQQRRFLGLLELGDVNVKRWKLTRLEVGSWMLAVDARLSSSRAVNRSATRQVG